MDLAPVRAPEGVYSTSKPIEYTNIQAIINEVVEKKTNSLKQIRRIFQTLIMKIFRVTL